MNKRALLLLLLFPSCISNNNKHLRDELLFIFHQDQLYRAQLSHSNSEAETNKLWEKQGLIDSLNLIRVVKILDSMGNPGKSIVGDLANEACFFVIQHADLKYQEKYLPMFMDAASKNELPLKSVVMMIDRVRIEKGEKQLYGTQMIPVQDPKTGYNTDQYQFAPIEDEKNVNKRRLPAGLDSIEVQARENNIKYVHI